MTAGTDSDASVLSVFHGSRYHVSVSSSSDEVLRVDVELEEDASRWRGEFTAKYVSEITAKTGSHKAYPVFVNMLVSALRGTSASVCVDLLTYADLELLKAKRLRRAGHAVPSRPASAAANNKRYLILTHAGEFDKVHFPLPLAFEEFPDPAHLKRTVAVLRAELAAERARAPLDLQPEVDRLRRENADLAAEVAAAAAAARGRDDATTSAAAGEAARADALEERLAATEAQMAAMRVEHKRALRCKAREAAEAVEDATAARAQLRELRTQKRDLLSEVAQLQRDATHQPASVPFSARYSRADTPSRATTRSREPPARRVASPYMRERPARIRTASAASSAASDATSRGGTPHRGRSQPPSRPSSAPPRPPRFDPTAYVRERRAREAASAERAARATFSPASSRPGSAHSTPRAPQRSRSVGSRCRDEPRGAGRRERHPVESSPRRSLSVRTRPVGRAEAPTGRSAASPAVQQQRDEGRRPWGSSRDASVRRRLSSGADSESRAASPGRALQQVKAKISEYKRRTEEAAACAPPSSASELRGRRSDGGVCDDVPGQGAAAARGSGGGQEAYHDASEEIADIDTRLQALQDFLRSAKAGA